MNKDEEKNVNNELSEEDTEKVSGGIVTQKKKVRTEVYSKKKESALKALWARLKLRTK